MSFKNFRKSFTLVELLTVVAIIGVLIGIVMGLMSLATGKSAEARTKSAIQRLSVALENYKAKYGYYIQAPSATAFYLDYVDSSLTSGTSANYINNNFCQFIDYESMKNKDSAGLGTLVCKYWILDGYGNPLVYRCPGYYNRNGFDLGSVGADSKWGSGAAFSGSAINDTSLKASFGQGDDLTNFTR